MPANLKLAPALGRQFAVTAILDLALTVSVVVVWRWLGVLGFGVALLTTLVRVTVAGLDLRRLLSPVQAWLDAGDDGQNEQLVLAADAAIQRLSSRFARDYVLGWLGCYLAWVAVAVWDQSLTGAAELTSLATMTVGVLLALPILVRPMFDIGTLDLALEVSAVIESLGLAHRRRPTSITKGGLRICLGLVVGAILGMAGVGKYAEVQAVREAAMVEQQRRAEVSAARLGAGGEALDDVTIVDTATLPDSLADAAEASGWTEVVTAHDGARELAVAAAPLGDGRFVLAEAEPDEHLDEFVVDVLGLVLLVFPLVGLVGWAHGRSLSSPLERFAEATERFVAGELRALERVTPLRNDELGRLALSFNRMLDLLAELTQAAEAVAAGDLTVELERPGELHDAFRGMLAQLHDMVERIRETSLELATAAAEIHAITQQHEQAADEQATNVRQVSEMVVSLARSAENISTTAADVLDNANRALGTTDTMVAKIGDLSGQTQRIGDLLGVIHDIAKRSDLLALNGSLESTHAGEAGRGFALVAAEMRRLAERVSDTVANVRDHLGDIATSGRGAVLATEESRKLAHDTAEAARGISRVTAEQSVATEQAAHGVQAVADMVVTAATATSQTLAAADGLHVRAAELERLTGAFRLRVDADAHDDATT